MYDAPRNWIARRGNGGYGDAGAARVDVQEFRTFDVNFGLGRSMVSRDFQVWELPDREARVGEEYRGWRLGVRLGAAASGERSRRICYLSSTPPGIRKAAFREVMDVLRYKGKVGYPPSVATDAQLGFSAMAYQYAEVLFGQREGIPVRFEGTCPRVRRAGKKADNTQRAKVGFCACCARPTHIAVPARYVVGEFPSQRALGISLWMEHGP